jgi:aminobenzoyl-glutamate utilization protein B
MTDTEFDVEVLSAVWPLRANRTLAELMQRAIARVGMPAWTAEEQAFARALQGKANVAAEGLRTEIKRSSGAAVQRASANDAGDISWKVPMAKFYFPANVPNLNFHHWAAGAPLATSIAHKGAVAGAKALAAAVIECLTDPAVVAEAKESFRQETAGVAFKSLLPPNQKPPTALNHPLMEKFRPAMAQHYLRKMPEFI